MVGLIVAIAIVCLNVFDGFATLWVIGSGTATEMNPIILFAIEHMKAYFIIPKVLISCVAGILIGAYWEKFSIAKIGGIFVLAIYTLIAIYHVYGFIYYGSLS